MAVYSKSGTSQNFAYNKSGASLTQAYDINGNPLLASDPVQLTVMQYNPGQWYYGNGHKIPSNYATIYTNLARDIMATYEPDIAGFEEYWDPMSDGYSVESVLGEFFTDKIDDENTNAYKRNAIISNGFPFSDTSFPTIAEYGMIKTKIDVGGRDVWIIATHLSNTRATRIQEGQALFNLVSQLPYFIILGDFNIMPMSTEDEEYTLFMKQFIDAGYHSANCSTQHGFFWTWYEGLVVEEVGQGGPNDGIITSGNITIDEVILDTTKQAVAQQTGKKIDHCPLVAKLTVY